MPRVTIELRVPFADVDASQRIHFTAMFRYMEVAEHTLMRSIGFPYSTTLTDLAMPRVHLSCDFVGAVRYDDLITVTAEVTHVGRSSWTLTFLAQPAPQALAGAPTPHGATLNAPVRPTMEAGGAVLARGRMTIVCMDPATERATPIPDELRAALLE